MTDIMFALDAFGSYAGKGGMPVFQERWNFHCDIDGNPKDAWDGTAIVYDGGWRDRKCDMGDIMQVIDNFGASGLATWQPLTPMAHDLSTSMFSPTYENVTSTPPPYTITYAVTNLGTSTESNVILTLTIDNATINPGGVNVPVHIVVTQTILSLAPGATSTFTYSWTPATPAQAGMLYADEYAFDNYATPVAGETYTANNDVTGYCYVIK
jgi:hypothetical protein